MLKARPSANCRFCLISRFARFCISALSYSCSSPAICPSASAAPTSCSRGASLGYNLPLGVNDLLGPGVFFAFVAGRYYHPRLEERVLLFIDMRASTAIAERLGEVHFLDFLNRFITDLSLAIAETGGEIHKYVGDEIIATWGHDKIGAMAYAKLDKT